MDPGLRRDDEKQLLRVEQAALRHQHVRPVATTGKPAYAGLGKRVRRGSWLNPLPTPATAPAGWR
jgi:hypothetical protein